MAFKVNSDFRRAKEDPTVFVAIYNGGVIGIRFFLEDDNYILAIKVNYNAQVPQLAGQGSALDCADRETKVCIDDLVLESHLIGIRDIYNNEYHIEHPLEKGKYSDEPIAPTPDDRHILDLESAIMSSRTLPSLLKEELGIFFRSYEKEADKLGKDKYLPDYSRNYDEDCSEDEDLRDFFENNDGEY